MKKKSKKKRSSEETKEKLKTEKNIPPLFSELLDQPPIDKTDMSLLQLLQKNARMTNIEIAEKLNTSEATVRRRINNLMDRGYIRSFAALLDYKRMGNAVKANVLAKVEKDNLERVANSLKKSKNVHMLCQVIGDYNLFCELIFNNILELQEFTDKLSNNPDVEKMDYYIVTKSFKSCPWSGL
ncbi:MAG: Lrp/AsnC family transcriptional regulator [Methanomassiliicoccales archaeon]|nr:MAG: Lrp/AsnC family transcriptional regulator [Methanomassiliicoccales archaeon]